MTRRTVGFLVTLALGLLVAPLATDAPPAKVHRIGVLSSASPLAASVPSLLVQGLRDLGYVEGQSIAFAYRHAEGNLDRLPDLAAELVRLPVEILVAEGVAAALAAQHATTTLPIVFSGVTDPVGRGLVTSLARPGANLTRVAFDAGPEIMGKRLELLTEVVPTISRVAMLSGNVRVPTAEAGEQERARIAQALGLTLRYFSVRQPEEFAAQVFPALTADAPAIDALHAGGPVVSESRQQIADFALQHRLPLIGIQRDLAAAGALFSYRPSLRAIQQRTAVLVGKILQGATPADLPVEQPTPYELVLNLKTAQALGLTIPSALLFRATEVIR
jgi:putative tryptophan/tyrosine transport system substrate-binding protein